MSKNTLYKKKQLLTLQRPSYHFSYAERDVSKFRLKFKKLDIRAVALPFLFFIGWSKISIIDGSKKPITN